MLYSWHKLRQLWWEEGGRFQETSEVEMTKLMTSQREKSSMNLLLLPKAKLQLIPERSLWQTGRLNNYLGID